MKRRLWDEAGIFLALALLAGGLALASPVFWTADNLLTVARQFSVIAIIAVGMTFVIVAGEIDLSVGSVLALSGVVTASLAVDHGWPLGAAAVSIGVRINKVFWFKGAVRSVRFAAEALNPSEFMKW